MVDPSDSSIRDLAHQILARDEYVSGDPTKNPGVRLIHTFLSWVSSLASLHDTSPALFWLVLVSLVIVAALLIAHIVWSISIAMRAPVPQDEVSISGDRSHDFIGEADRLAAGGRYLEAAHRLMLASFRTLAERSLIELRPERPNRWIREALRRSHLARSLVDDLDTLILLTERRWFGDRQNDSEMYVHWRSAFERLSSLE